MKAAKCIRREKNLSKLADCNFCVILNMYARIRIVILLHLYLILLI